MNQCHCKESVKISEWYGLLNNHIHFHVYLINTRLFQNSTRNNNNFMLRKECYTKDFISHKNESSAGEEILLCYLLYSDVYSFL